MGESFDSKGRRVRDISVCPFDRCNCVALETRGVNNPAQPGTEHQDQDDQPAHAHAQESPPETRGRFDLVGHDDIAQTGHFWFLATQYTGSHDGI